MNQVVRRRHDDVDALLESSARLRQAQEAALRGGGGDEFDDAVREERRLVRELVGEAEQVLAESGRAPSAAARERISQTLRAAAADEEGRELLATGRFVTDFEPTGFGALTGIKVPAGARTARPRAKTTSAPKRERPSADAAKAERAELRVRNREARQSLVEARDRERDLRQRVRKAEKEAEQARKAADRAEAEAESLRRQASEAAAAVAAAEQALFALRRAGA